MGFVGESQPESVQNSAMTLENKEQSCFCLEVWSTIPQKQFHAYYDQIVSELFHINGDPRFFTEIKLDGKPISGLIDSGATCSLIGSAYNRILSPNMTIHPLNRNIRTADNTSHKILGYALIPITFKNTTHILPILIVPTIPKQLILGVDFVKRFNLMPELEVCNVDIEDKCNSTEHELNEAQKRQLFDVISSFKIADGESLQQTNVDQHTIDTGEAKPIKQRHHPISPYVQSKVDVELDRMLKLKVIEPCHSPWNSPIVAVKKDEQRVRLCLDSRKLNSVTIPDAYPLNHIGRILGRFTSTKFLSTIDLRDAFWQINLNPHSRPKTAFSVAGRGQFQFRVMPFGLNNSAQTLVRIMDQILGPDLEPEVFVYLDDIVIATDTFERHIQLIQEVANRLCRANFSISLQKSSFCKKSIKFLGYIVSENGLAVDPEKTKPVREYPAPKSHTEIRRFIGMISWYSRFIKNFSEYTAPINDILRLKKFCWTPEANAAFEDLKKLLITPPILGIPDYKKQFSIHCDASDRAIGSVLVQGEGDDLVTIAYHSKKLSATECKYSSTERECLAVLLSIEKFRPYIEGSKFKVITDHASLLWLINFKHTNGKLVRWAMRLSEHNFELQHRKGKLHVVPDALSRAVVEALQTGQLDIADEWYKDMLEKVTNHPTTYPKFKIVDGKLLKLCKIKNELLLPAEEWRIVVPQNSVPDVLREHHDLPISGHLGVAKTTARIKTFYYWQRMDDDIKRYVSNCDVCKTSKDTNQNTVPPMMNQLVVTHKWETIAVDFSGPYPRTRTGNTVIFVVVDVLTKFCLIYPMRQAEAVRMVKILKENIFLVYGTPKRIISDNGTQFLSKEYKRLLDDYGVEPFRTPKYHAQANMAERYNRVIGQTIRSYLGEDHTRWDELLPEIGCAIRTATNDSSKYTPYFLNFGTEIVKHGKDFAERETIERANAGSGIVQKDPENKIIENINQTPKLLGIVKENLKKAFEHQAKYYNLRSTNRVSDFAPGETVFTKNFVLSDKAKKVNAKLAKRKIKAVVVRKEGQNNYILKDMQGKNLGLVNAKYIFR